MYLTIYLCIYDISIASWWLFAEKFFLCLGIEAGVCELISRYLKIRSLSVPADIVIESYEKYLSSIGVMSPSMWANGIFNVFLTVINCYFVLYLGRGFEWLAVSWNISLYLSLIFLYLIRYSI
jgi:Na+-driven multidrug efflux pump